ncbi:hypothetical protein SUGI_0901750 [Cryptomeria japonica]|uniref:phytosulfokines 4-like n=1 Tax=Cryptomeria japonica TaxID=3369 RepID=UPI002414B5FF|nr:phytosulfokines 4-like [Cryptomeria japonica]GLJ43399.1 hypothetical protein SUGI_0901750 [Cryptomeria japonica]
MAKVYRSSVQQGRLWIFSIFIIFHVLAVMAARPHPIAPLKASTLFTKDQMEIKHNFDGRVEKEESKVGNECRNEMSEEECLDRRTLVAHTDYIYTQEHKGP